MKNKYIVFDLDDTLTYEIDFLKSAYRDIALSLNKENLYEIMFDKYQKGENVFEYLSNEYQVEIPTILEQYRNHFPNIELIDEAKEVLNHCKSNGYKLGLITDGRSVTQRNKLKALGIENWLDKIIISEEFGSEKPNENNYLAFMIAENCEYFYIADNPKKDFITPNKLGWKTICLLDSGKNIHKQNFDLEKMYLPQYKINSLNEILNILIS